jgi:hypothetical protein
MNPQQYYGGSFSGLQSEHPGTRRPRRIVLVVTLLVLVILTAVFAVISSRPENSGATIMDKIIKGDAETSYAMLSGAAAARFTKDEWKSEVSRLSKLYSGYTLDKQRTEKRDTDTEYTTSQYVLTNRQSDTRNIAWVIIETEVVKDTTMVVDYQYQSLKDEQNL